MKKQILILYFSINSIFLIHAQIYTPNGTIEGSSGNNNVGIGINDPIAHSWKFISTNKNK